MKLVQSSLTGVDRVPRDAIDNRRVDIQILQAIGAIDREPLNRESAMAHRLIYLYRCRPELVALAVPQLAGPKRLHLR